MERFFLGILVLGLFVVSFDYLSKQFENKDYHRLSFIARLIGVYLPIIIYTIYCAYLMTESHQAFVIVAISLTIMVAIWIIYMHVFVRHKYNYLILVLPVVISYIISFIIIPKYSLMVIPSVFFSGMYGSSLVGFSKKSVNKTRMFVMTLVIGLCFISAYVYNSSAIKAQTIPYQAVKTYLEEEGIADHRISILGQANTRYDMVLIFCVPPEGKKYLVLDYYKGEVIFKHKTKG